MKLHKNVTALWAKKNFEHDEQLWLPLVVHLTDAKNTINWLYNHWLSDSQRQLLKYTSPDETDERSDEDVQKLVKFLGFTHDIGKATPAFQKKRSYIRDDYLDDQLVEKLIRSGFSELDESDLSSARASPHAIAGEAILEHYGVPNSVGAIIGGHHGSPAQEAPRKQIVTYTAN